MPELHQLQPHDPVPESGRFLLVMRRFAEDNPSQTIVELVISDGRDPPRLTIPTEADGQPAGFEAAIRLAQSQATGENFPQVYAVDRTAGRREREVLRHGGDHSVNMDRLDDTDPEDGETGSDIRDRRPDAGYNLTPQR